MTRNNSKCTLNVALAYTSRFLKKEICYWDLIICSNYVFFKMVDYQGYNLYPREEMTRATRNLAVAVKAGQLSESEVSTGTLTRAIFLNVTLRKGSTCTCRPQGNISTCNAGHCGTPGGNALHSALPPCRSDDQNLRGEKALGFPSMAV